MVTDSILTDETDLNLSAESTLQSPAFRRITITEDDKYSETSLIGPPLGLKMLALIMRWPY